MRWAEAAVAVALLIAPSAQAQSCRGTVYLTIDTGWMDQAEHIAEVLRRHQVRATLFIADEPTFRGDTSLAEAWAPFWRARAAEGHAFGSHTLRHWYFRGDVGATQVRFVPWGAREGVVLDARTMCDELRAPEARLKAMTGRGLDPIWRAPGGRTTPNALRFAEACGFRHVGWSANGFLGDELPVERGSNAKLLDQALRSVKDREVMVMHWGIRSRAEPFGAVMEPLILGLKQRGLCFATLTEPGAPR